MENQALDLLKSRLAYRTPNFNKPLQQIVLQRADAEALASLFDSLLAAIAALGKLMQAEAERDSESLNAAQSSHKPFAGIISDWRKDGSNIMGVCEWHATYANSIEQGKPMYTSPVVSILRTRHFAIAETKNSIYVLIRPADGKCDDIPARWRYPAPIGV